MERRRASRGRDAAGDSVMLRHAARARRDAARARRHAVRARRHAARACPLCSTWCISNRYIITAGTRDWSVAGCGQPIRSEHREPPRELHRTRALANETRPMTLWLYEMHAWTERGVCGWERRERLLARQPLRFGVHETALEDARPLAFRRVSGTRDTVDEAKAPWWRTRVSPQTVTLASVGRSVIRAAGCPGMTSCF